MQSLSLITDLFSGMQIRKKIYPWWNSPKFLVVLAVLQIVILLFLLLTWPITLNIPVLKSEIADLQLLAKDWQKRHPNILINFIPYETTDALEQIYTNDLQKNSPDYDLVYMDVIWLPKFAESGWLKELEKEFTPAELKAFLDDEIDRGRGLNKSLYRIPFRSDAGVLFYRKDLLGNDSQPPNTFEQLFEKSLNISKKFKNPNSTFWGYLWQAGKYEGLVTTFLEVLSGYGGFWIRQYPDPNKVVQYEVGLDREHATNAIQFLRRTIDKKVSPPYNIAYQEDAYLEKFKKGEAAFLRSWPDSWAKINADDSPIKGKVGLTQIVGFKDSGAGCLGGWGFGISKKAQHPEAALQAIKFFTSKEVQRKFVLESSYLPSRKELFSEPEIQKKYPHFPKMLQIVENAVERPRITNYKQVSDILQCHLSKALLSNSDQEVGRIMVSAKEKTDALLNKNKTNQPSCDDI